MRNMLAIDRPAAQEARRYEVSKLQRLAFFKPNPIERRSRAMESATFRKWLVQHGCRIDHGEHQQRHEGQAMVTVHREGRKAEVPLGGSRQALDARMVSRACEELGLDPAQLPGPKSRV